MVDLLDEMFATTEKGYNFKPQEQKEDAKQFIYCSNFSKVYLCIYVYIFACQYVRHLVPTQIQHNLSSGGVSSLGDRCFNNGFSGHTRGACMGQWKGVENPRSCGQLQSVRNEVNAFLKLSCVEQCESRADD